MSSSPRSPARIAVLGAGSWGTALAIHLARCGHHVLLWGRDAGQVEEMARTGRNEKYLPGTSLPDGVEPLASLEQTIAQTDEAIVATPSSAFCPLLGTLADTLRPAQGLAWACKGLEPDSGRFLHEPAAEMLPEGTSLAVITGPSFASEVAAGLPTALTVAGTDENFSTRIASLLHGGNFRAYTSDDIVGAELGGAVKNVLAIATGICDGMKLGNNARAALITRGLAEMMRLGEVIGAQPRTLTGLAGIGDLVLTCTGDLSRNRRLGLALGAGMSVDDAVRRIGQVVEGVGTSSELLRLAERHDVEMPISKQVDGILHKGWNPSESVRRLLARERKAEVG